MGSRKPEIETLVAALGYADIFSIKEDLSLKTTLCPTGVATEVNLSSVFFQKYISGQKYRFRQCR